MKNFKAVRWFSCIHFNKGFRFLLASAAVILAMVFGVPFNASAVLQGGSIQGTTINVEPAAVSTFAGTAGVTGTINGTGTAARFNSPAGMTTDGINLYVADGGSYLIRKIVISTGVVTTIAGTGSAGSVDNTTGTAASFRFINGDKVGITTDGTNLYVADTGNHTIRKIVLTSPYQVTTIAGTAGTSGSADGIGAAASFWYPHGITTDGTNLYVSDTVTNRIRKIDLTSLAVTTIAGATAGSADGIGTAASFNYPRGITTDGINLYVVDSSNYTIRKIVISSLAVTTIAGTTTSGSTDGTGTAARFYLPYGITTDGTNLYVADLANNTIRKIVISTQVVTTISGTGSTGSADGIGTAASFSGPAAITTDGTNLYVTDTSNHTLRKLAAATYTVTTTSGAAAMIQNAGAVTVDAGVTVVSNASTITDGTVSITSGLASGDTLACTSCSSVDHTYSATTGILTLSGTLTPANWQALFRGVTIRTTSASATARTVAFTIGSPIPFSTANKTVNSTPASFTVTPSAGTGGSISPSTPQTVNNGSTTTFTVTSSAGYTTSSVTGTCGGSLSGTTYTTSAITANCTVIASFTATITTPPPAPTPPCSYSISPSALSFSVIGGSGSFNVTPYSANYCNKPGWTAVSNNSWITINSGSSGDSTTVPVTFTVSANNSYTASRTGTITITGNSNTETMTITQNALLTLSANSLNYGTIPTSETATKSLTVTNASGGSLTLSGVNITGADSGDFTLTNNCATLSNNGSCTLDVKFMPTTAGSKTATLTITANGISFTVALTGTADDSAKPMISVTPTEVNDYLELEFGSNITLTVGNAGTGTLLIGSIKFYGEDLYEYTVTGSSCSMIRPQESCSVMLKQAIISNQAKNASLVITSNASNSPKLEIPIKMTSLRCTAGSLSISPGSVTVLSDALAGTLTVTALNNCLWTASSKSDWISVASNWTSGNGTVNYSVSANTGSASRIGTINMGGIPFTIIQYAQGVSRNYTDISGYKFEDNINALYSAGIADAATNFYPANSATKEDIAVYIIRAVYGETFTYTTTPYFSDVPVTHPSFKYVQKLKDDGITQAVGAFEINDGLSRSWAAAFIIRAIYGETFSYPTALYFSDVPIDHVYFKYIQKMKERGFTHASTGGEYLPDNIMDRDSLAAFISDAFLGMEHY